MRFELMYESFVRRETVTMLTQQKDAMINAIRANGGYLQTKEAQDARQREIEDIQAEFEAMIDDVLDPQPDVDLSANPFFRAGQQELERLKWEYDAAQVQARLQEAA